MAEQPDSHEPAPGDRITYFMVRIHHHAAADPPGHHHAAGEPAAPSGIVERLGSGCKQVFTGTAELVRLLTGEPDDPAAMMDPATGGNK
jgi:hypothetical protein